MSPRCLTCSLGPECKRLAVLTEAVLVLAGYPDVVVVSRGQTLEHAFAGEEVVAVVPGADPDLLGPVGVLGVLGLPLQLEGGDGRDGLRDPLQGVVHFGRAVRGGLDVGGAGESCMERHKGKGED